MNNNPHTLKPVINRKDFILNTLKTAGALSIAAIPGSCLFSNPNNPRAFTVQDVIDIILKEVPGAPYNQTVDTIKSGSAQQTVTGIVSTMFATKEVIDKTAELGANFIIAHEPTFYNHTDDTNWVAGNHIVQQKQQLLQQKGITVWRFHDYWHSVRPDGVYYGVVKNAGWLNYFEPGKSMLNIPPVSLKDLALHLKSSLGITQVKVIGDLNQSCQRIGLIPGAAGGQRQVSFVEQEKPDVLIVGEVHEWETAEYVRDTQAFGGKTSLIILGHSVSEEPGMQWLVNWLQPKVPGIKVTHVASGDPFTWI